MTPQHWHRDVHVITMDSMNMLGFKPSTRELYWDGHPVVTERRFNWVERSLAGVGLIIGLIGAIAACAQAWAAWLSIPHS